MLSIEKKYSFSESFFYPVLPNFYFLIVNKYKVEMDVSLKRSEIWLHFTTLSTGNAKCNIMWLQIFL
ncbi:unnamed protein product [Acanthoscelides obtectus]|uniref:Uncharacterized protein n=1 Tax=Acanthoscelides obtectus TaxID=200917 RepID=A0A9P0PI09_ACAOB|nr:unnamed protein product [Acanthoscelides obtectus]CAK1650599.1 hypothetical protein AOBTE_LOCUS16826 [Acanthoscelides obtectus]